MAKKKSPAAGPAVEPEIIEEILAMRAQGVGPLSIRVRLSKKNVFVSVSEIKMILAQHGVSQRSELTVAPTKGKLTGFWSPEKKSR